MILEKIRLRVEAIEKLLTKDVNEIYSQQEFKEVMSNNHGSFLQDIAIRLMQKFKSQIKQGIETPVPHLG